MPTSEFYKSATDNINRQENPEGMLYKRAFLEDVSKVSYSDVSVFVRTAMKAVEPEYTQRSRDAGEKVKNHLSPHISNVSFQYQGSVMTNTHIRGYSDIDLLTICEEFYWCDGGGISRILSTASRKGSYSNSALQKLATEQSRSKYSGNGLDDLRNKRHLSEGVLSSVYQACDVSHPKAIKVTNSSLNRDVDVVIANWYDDVMSVVNDKGDYRGVQIYDKDLNERGVPDYPFLSIQRINQKSSGTNGRLKKMIRFLKNCKECIKNEVKLSSFDINAICYDIDTTHYADLSYLQLVGVLYSQLESICKDQSHSASLLSVDGREYIFGKHPEKLQHLRELHSIVTEIFLDLKKEEVI